MQFKKIELQTKIIVPNQCFHRNARSVRYNFVFSEFSQLTMPIYDYKCSHCGYKAEVMRKISAPSLEACPECAFETFSKQLSAPSFQLSGSGWYATDFKNGSKPPVSKEASNTESASQDNQKDSVKQASTDNEKVGKSEDASKSAVEKKPEATSGACDTGCACH